MEITDSCFWHTHFLEYFIKLDLPSKTFMYESMTHYNFFNIFTIRDTVPSDTSNPTTFSQDVLKSIDSAYDSVYSYRSVRKDFKDVSQEEISLFEYICDMYPILNFQVVVFYKVLEGSSYFLDIFVNILIKRGTTSSSILVDLLKKLNIINDQECHIIQQGSLQEKEEYLKNIVSRLVNYSELIASSPSLRPLMILFYLLFVKNNVNNVNMEDILFCLTKILHSNRFNTLDKLKMHTTEINSLLAAAYRGGGLAKCGVRFPLCDN